MAVSREQKDLVMLAITALSNQSPRESISCGGPVEARLGTINS